MDGLHKNTGTKAALYARVSQEVQAQGESVSIDQQLAEMRSLCDRMGWGIAGVFVDCENYKAALPPRKGKIVNPSGERADRPALLKMLELVRTGRTDVVLCWRDDRLVRHPRVAVALEDALDIGDTRRNGRGRIEIHDATGATIDRFTLNIKAAIWREENKRRAERTAMGKLATLKQGRWPGLFKCHGYQTVKEEGKRGYKIVLDPEVAPVVRRIFEEYASGQSISEIRTGLMADGIEQTHFPRLRRHPWSSGALHNILRKETYLGKATWRFRDGTVVEVDVPQIIDPELWRQVQRVKARNRKLCKRNAKGVYLLQGLTRCGECGNGLSVSTGRTMGGGYCYKCHTAAHNDKIEGTHPRPYTHGGLSLDWAVWRHVVDFGIKRPDLIRSQVVARQQELIAQGESVESDLARTRSKLEEVAQARAFYQRQAARGRIEEEEFDERMEETETEMEYWKAELVRLQELRDGAEAVQDGLEYATQLMEKFQERLAAIDQAPMQLRKLPEEERNAVLKQRKEIIQILCDEVIVWADKRVKLVGVLDGTEGAQFELRTPYYLR